MDQRARRSCRFLDTLRALTAARIALGRAGSEAPFHGLAGLATGVRTPRCYRRQTGSADYLSGAVADCRGGWRPLAVR